MPRFLAMELLLTTAGGRKRLGGGVDGGGGFVAIPVPGVLDAVVLHALTDQHAGDIGHGEIESRIDGGGELLENLLVTPGDPDSDRRSVEAFFHGVFPFHG